VDVFTRFLPERAVRDRLGQELAYTMNLTKEQTAFLATTYKPTISLTPTALQVGTILSSVFESQLSCCALWPDRYSIRNILFSIPVFRIRDPVPLTPGSGIRYG
jgi:hypothetical protein